MTPSKQNSAKRCSGVTSILTRRIDNGSLLCALNAWTKNIFEKIDLRRKSICTSISILYKADPDTGWTLRKSRPRIFRTCGPYAEIHYMN